MTRIHHWQHMTRKEVGEAVEGGALPVIPIGAIEQHSDHLPVGTDTFLVEHVCVAAACRAERHVVVLPALAVGFSPHHAQWPGTLTMSLSTLYGLIDDVTRSVARAGFTRQLIVNGHGGNRAPLSAIATELITAGREVGVLSYWEPASQEISRTLTGIRKKIGHACEFETSLILELVRNGALPDRPQLRELGKLPPVPDSPAAFSSKTPFSRGVGWWPPVFARDHCGYEGDPATASAERGRELFSQIVLRLAEFFEEFAELDLRSGGVT